MKPLMPALLICLLSACNPEPAAPAAQTQPDLTPATADTASASSDMATTSDPAPIAQTHGGAAEPTPQAQGESDDHGNVNQTLREVLGDPTQYEKAILTFQQAVAQKDAATVASMIDFPFKTHVDNRPATIADSAEFIAKYGQIVTPEMAEVITRQRYSDLFVNQKGVMFGSGEAWLNGVCQDDKCEKVEVRVVALQPGQ